MMIYPGNSNQNGRGQSEPWSMKSRTNSCQVCSPGCPSSDLLGPDYLRSQQSMRWTDEALLPRLGRRHLVLGIQDQSLSPTRDYTLPAKYHDVDDKSVENERDTELILHTARDSSSLNIIYSTLSCFQAHCRWLCIFFIPHGIWPCFLSAFVIWPHVLFFIGVVW